LDLNSSDITGTGNLNITGNISLSGTVDGRDVATDGTKLDGIEASATADQTASEILTAIKTVDGASSGLDSDLLDGQHGSHYLNYNNFSNTPTIPTNNNQLTNGAGYVTANTQLSNEQVQDIVGAMVSSNSESGITVTYQDSDGTLDFSVASQTDQNFTNADHSKLDGIETGATADQSASEILTLIKTVDGSGSGLDADTLDGISSGSFLRSDAADTCSGSITFNGRVNIRDNLDLSDGEQLVFGSSDDVKIYYDGGNNWVYCNFVTGNGILFQDNGSNKIVMEDSGVFRPGTNGTGTVGNTANYWENGYFQNFNISGTLNVRGAIDLADNDVLRLGSGDDAEFFVNGSHMYTDLNSGIGNWYIRDGSTTRFTFDDAGHFTATGNINSSSDVRLKTNIRPLEKTLEKVTKLRGVKYDRVDIESDNCIGVIAQEVEEVYPEFVNEGDDGMKGVDYSKMVAVLIEAVKEQQQQINDLKNEIKSLKG
jgi:hypothetical protein